LYTARKASVARHLLKLTTRQAPARNVSLHMTYMFDLTNLPHPATTVSLNR